MNTLTPELAPALSARNRPTPRRLKAVSVFALAAVVLGGCSKAPTEAPKTAEKAPAPAYFHVDPSTAGTVTGTIKFTGRKPKPKPIDMSNDPACVEAHHGKAYDEPVVVGANGGLADTFIYIKTGLEGKQFEVPTAEATIDQHGCWFEPRVLGVQVGQPVRISNSDPVTHNIHPLPQNNREWNHSQGAGDAPIVRRFTRPEVMIPVKCNIHSWMHAYVGVLPHPYFAVSGKDGTFQIPNVPPGNYVIEAWQQTLGTQDLPVTVTPSGKVEADFTFKGE